MKTLFANEQLWRYLAHFWMAFTLAVGLSEVAFQAFGFLLSSVAVMYIASLSMYAGTKEFSRWHELYESKRHPGEFMVLLWTLYMAGLIAYIVGVNNGSRIPDALISTYIAVLGIFAITSRSKYEYEKRLKEEPQKE